ncbi:unnamed protein product [Boreogadus saida]
MRCSASRALFGFRLRFSVRCSRAVVRLRVRFSASRACSLAVFGSRVLCSRVRWFGFACCVRLRRAVSASLRCRFGLCSASPAVFGLACVFGFACGVRLRCVLASRAVFRLRACSAFRAVFGFAFGVRPSVRCSASGAVLLRVRCSARVRFGFPYVVRLPRAGVRLRGRRFGCGFASRVPRVSRAVFRFRAGVRLPWVFGSPAVFGLPSVFGFACGVSASGAVFGFSALSASGPPSCFARASLSFAPGSLFPPMRTDWWPVPGSKEELAHTSTSAFKDSSSILSFTLENLQHYTLENLQHYTLENLQHHTLENLQHYTVENLQHYTLENLQHYTVENLQHYTLENLQHYTLENLQHYTRV